MNYDHKNQESITQRVAAIQYIYVSIGLIFAGLLALIKRMMLSGFYNIDVYLTLLGLFSTIIFLALFVLKGRLFHFHTALCLFFMAMVVVRLYIVPTSDQMISLGFLICVGVLNSLLKGIRWAVASILIIFIGLLYGYYLGNIGSQFLFSYTTSMFLVTIPVWAQISITSSFVDLLAKAQKENYTKTLINRLSHEILNPLNVISLQAAMIEEESSDDIIVKSAFNIQDKVDVIAKLIKTIDQKTSQSTESIDKNRNVINIMSTLS